MPALISAGGQITSSIRQSELGRVPFLAGSLKMTFTKFDNNVAVSSVLRNTGVGYIEVTIENLSPVFAAFAPQKLTFVDRNNEQANILGIRHVNEIFPAPETRIAPQARIKGRFNLTDKLDPPVRIYYDDRLLGTIID
jgi:hypothetical protein